MRDYEALRQFATPAQIRYLDAIKQHSTQGKAAKALGVSKRAMEQSLARLVRCADAEGVRILEVAQPQHHPGSAYDVELRALRTELASIRRDNIDAGYVKNKIVKLADMQPDPPKWLISNNAPKKSPGVPTLFASDWHWGETVDGAQVGGVNEYNLAIAQSRARKMVETCIDLLNNHMVNPQYPGIVFALGGDMVSGDIHDELTATNEREMMPVILDLFGVLIWCISTLADNFGKVFVPCVGGNHGRNTVKIRAKGRNFTSFDWLLYCFLQKHFEKDRRIVFHIPDGPDALYSVYGRRYLLTHGDQFRGGDGMIGALGPIVRGDHKKRSRNNQIDMSYDTMLLGHWHQLIQLERLIVNGSLCGYNEYAYNNNFGFEPPKQALWITNREHGITFAMPVHVGGNVSKAPSEWISWASSTK